MFQRDNLFKSAGEYSTTFIGSPVRVKKESIPIDTFLNEKLGKFRYFYADTSIGII